jgi:hypothetical protein
MSGGILGWCVITLNLEWIRANRYIPELTCNQRELYRLEPLCESEE